jgi:hypothetical protein
MAAKPSFDWLKKLDEGKMLLLALTRVFVG